MKGILALFWILVERQRTGFMLVLILSGLKPEVIKKLRSRNPWSPLLARLRNCNTSAKWIFSLRKEKDVSLFEV